jgi:hypothetical protein
MHTRIYVIDLQLARCANSLALRIPAEIVRRLGLHEARSAMRMSESVMEELRSGARY